MARPPLKLVIARKREIKRRYERERRRRHPKQSWTTLRITLRVRELKALYEARYGNELPATKAGDDAIEVMCEHLALARDPINAVTAWLDYNCKWMITTAEKLEIANRSIANARFWGARELAFRLQLIEIDRRALGIRTIAACDVTDKQRKEINKEKKRQRDRARRRRNGAKLRSQSNVQTKPWLALGISRATWYRRGPSR